MDTPPVFVINLDKSPERMSRIAKRLDELFIPFERISGVYGAELSQEEIAQYYCPKLNKKNYRRPLGLGEIGCYISHIKAWQTIVDRKLPCGLILEDDIVIEEGLADLTKEFGRLSDTFDIVKFFNKKKNPKIVDSVDFTRKYKLCRFKKIPIGNYAQLISLAGAKKLLKTYEKFGRPVDEDLQHWWESDTNVIGVMPSVVRPNEGAQSDIDAQGKRKGTTTFLAFAKNVIRRAKFLFNLNTKRNKLPLL